MEADKPVEPLLVSMAKAAGILGIDKRTLYRLIARKEFPAPIKVGASTRVPRADIEAYVQGKIRQRER